MIKRRFLCIQCGQSFVAEVLEEGEAQWKRVPSNTFIYVPIGLGGDPISIQTYR